VQPDSMQAGLSSVLLQTISVTSMRLQELVIHDVVLKMLGELQNGIPEMRHVAYLSVLTSLVAKAAESSLFFALHTTLNYDEQVVSLLHGLIAKNLELDSQSTWEADSLVKYEKTLYFYCALIDLKHKQGPSVFAPCEFQSRVLFRVVEVMHHDRLARQAKFKMCFATLARQAEASPDVCSDALLMLLTRNDD